MRGCKKTPAASSVWTAATKAGSPSAPRPTIAFHTEAILTCSGTAPTGSGSVKRTTQPRPLERWGGGLRNDANNH